jgi:predicted small secreted protein
MAYEKTTKLLAVLALFTAASLLGACHTMAGAGKDIKATGQALQDSANSGLQDSTNDHAP